MKTVTQIVAVGRPRAPFLLLLLLCAGCAVRRPFAKAQLIVPRDCIERIEVLPDTECRQNLDGTGELVCKPLRLIRKKGCEHVEPPPK